MYDDDPLDRLEDHASRMATQMTYEQQNRLGLLWVHAVIGITAGLQMLVWGSATTIETALGTWSRALMAGLGCTGGALLAVGLCRRPRSIPFETAGLVLVGLWDFLMTAGLTYALVNQHDFHLIPLADSLPMGYVVSYPATIYGGLLALISIHLSTLRKLRRRK